MRSPRIARDSTLGMLGMLDIATPARLEYWRQSNTQSAAIRRSTRAGASHSEPEMVETGAGALAEWACEQRPDRPCAVGHRRAPPVTEAEHRPHYRAHHV